MTHHQQRSRSQKRYWRALRMLLLLSSLIVLVAVICVAVQRTFSVKEITINYPDRKDTIRGYEPYYATFLPLLSEKEVQNSLLSQNPTISKVFVKKQYPDKLLIALETNGPAVTFKVADEFILLTSTGRILQKVKTKPNNIPEISYYQELFKEDIKIGDIISFKDLQVAIKFIRLLSSLGYRVNQVDINSFYMIRLVLEDSREVLVTTEKDIQKQEYQVQAILRQFKVDGTDFKRLDVRFDKPIMTK